MLILFACMFFEQDNLSTWQIFGNLLICSGLIYLAVSDSTIADAHLIFAILSAFCIAGYTLVNGVGVRISVSFLVCAIGNKVV
jgi:drug/metabolite transporter (DMT)-like permease